MVLLAGQGVAVRLPPGQVSTSIKDRGPTGRRAPSSGARIEATAYVERCTCPIALFTSSPDTWPARVQSDESLLSHPFLQQIPPSGVRFAAGHREGGQLSHG
jgi:hypothetical protein